MVAGEAMDRGGAGAAVFALIGAGLVTFVKGVFSFVAA